MAATRNQCLAFSFVTIHMDHCHLVCEVVIETYKGIPRSCVWQNYLYIRNSDKCNAICTSGNYEEKL